MVDQLISQLPNGLLSISLVCKTIGVGDLRSYFSLTNCLGIIQVQFLCNC